MAEVIILEFDCRKETMTRYAKLQEMFIEIHRITYNLTQGT